MIAKAGVDKYIRARRLIDNGMPLDVALRSVGLCKAYFWRIGKRLREHPLGEGVKTG